MQRAGSISESDGFDGVEGCQIGRLGGPVTDPVEHRLTGQQQVEAQRRRRLGRQLESLAEQTQGVDDPVHGSGLLPGHQVPVGRRVSVATAGMVIGDDRGVLVDAAGELGHPLVPPRRQLVVDAAVPAQRPLVGHVAQQGVLEQELPAVVER